MGTGEWAMVIGAGLLWHGWQINWVAGLPRQLRRGEVAKAEPGSRQSFMRFWLDQYCWLGLGLCALGLMGFAIGLSRGGLS